MRFGQLGLFAALMFILGAAGIFFPTLTSLVIAFAAVFLAGVVVITGDYIVKELRGREAAP